MPSDQAGVFQLEWLLITSHDGRRLENGQQIKSVIVSG